MPFFGLFGPPKVEKLKAKRNVKGLIKALSYQKSHHVRRESAEALGEIRDSHAVEALIDALNDDNEYVCIAASKALGQIGDTRAVEPLIRLLGAHYWQTEAAAEALEKLGKASVEPLVAILKKKGTKADILTVSRRKAAAQILGKIGDGRTIEPLVVALKDEHEDIRSAVVQALGHIGDGRTIEPLVVALKDEHEDIRSAAVQALGHIGGTHVMESLATMLLDEDSKVRSTVVHTLRELRWEPTNAAQQAWLTIAELPWTDHSWNWTDHSWKRIAYLGSAVVEPLIHLVRDTQITDKVIELLEQILEMQAQSISQRDLRRVASLENVVQIRYFSEEGGTSNCSFSYCRSTKVTVDCSRVRQLARQELIRRGLEA